MLLTEEINPQNILDLFIKLREFSFNSKNDAVYINKDFYEKNYKHIIEIEEIIFRLNLNCIFNKRLNVILVTSTSYFRQYRNQTGSKSSRIRMYLLKVSNNLSKIKEYNCSHKGNQKSNTVESQLINYVTKFEGQFCKKTNSVNQSPFSVCYLISKGICVVNGKS